jgi:four helix bundle protein
MTNAARRRELPRARAGIASEALPAASAKRSTLALAKRDISRAFAFSLRILKVVRALPRDAAGQAIARQIVRSGTSVGANIEKAQGAQSKAEFPRRMSIAKSEAFETRYWLRLIAGSALLPSKQLAPLIAESDELVRILVTIVKRSRA